MRKLKIHSSPDVEKVFEQYPHDIRPKVEFLRELIIETAKETEGIDELTETLKWGEPSYLTKHGSTIRINWKRKAPTQYAMYFQCTSRLVPTFSLVFNEVFRFEGKRAIVFNTDQELPIQELKLCIKAALRYHKVKHLPLLGM